MRVGAVAFLAFLALLCTSGCGITVSLHPAVIFVGDSITHEWAQSYNGQQAIFGANNWLNVGVNGLTSREILAHYKIIVPFLEPPAVHIIGGTNDVYPGWQLSETTTHLAAMVSMAKQQHIAVVLGTIPPWGPEAIAEQADDTPQRFQRIAQLNQWIIAFASQQGVTVADYHAVLAAANGENYAQGLTYDGIHPSPAGYALMTPVAEQALRAAVVKLAHEQN